MQVWNVLRAARWQYRTQKIAKNSPSGHHRINLSGYIFATKACIDNRKKNLLNSNISSTCPHNMANFCPLTAEIGLPVCGTSANFNWFRILALLLQRRRSLEANQTLQDVWPSPGLPPNGILPGTKFMLRPSLAFSYIGSVIARHSSSGRQPNFVEWTRGTRNNFRRGCHLYSAGQPSCWASAHILVYSLSQWKKYKMSVRNIFAVEATTDVCAQTIQCKTHTFTHALFCSCSYNTTQ